MHYAAFSGSPAIIETLVRLGSRAIDLPDQNGSTPILVAATNQHEQSVQMLVRMGSRAIDTPDDQGYTPMHLAAGVRTDSVIETLVRLGSRAIDVHDNRGRTPLHLLLMGKGFASRVNLLRALGASTNIDTEGLSPEAINLLGKPMEEEEVVGLRYRVYFAHSLVDRLLQELQMERQTSRAKQKSRLPTGSCLLC